MNAHRTLPLALVAVCACSAPAAPLPENFTMIPGRFQPGQQPDGNSLLIRTEEGLLLVDTGRHRAHTQAILDAAQAQHLPIVAVVNSHWHLDHVGGNPRVRAAFPDVRVYASAAILAAQQGFLADYRAQLSQAIEQTRDAAQQQSWRDEIALIDAGPALRPDVTVTGPLALKLGGSVFELHLAEHAATAGDVWLYDPASATLAAGDLVTLPVPFLDTACPQGWSSALKSLAAMPFKQLVPGHGPVLDAAQFKRYQAAYDGLLACAASLAGVADCARDWNAALDDLVAASDKPRVLPMLDYYFKTRLRAEPAPECAKS
jgi:glyoxylase-like metal-dependent hydrolase (beta-lactamase superfamily II)